MREIGVMAIEGQRKAMAATSCWNAVIVAKQKKASWHGVARVFLCREGDKGEKRRGSRRTATVRAVAPPVTIRVVVAVCGTARSVAVEARPFVAAQSPFCLPSNLFRRLRGTTKRRENSYAKGSAAVPPSRLYHCRTALLLLAPLRCLHRRTLAVLLSPFAEEEKASTPEERLKGRLRRATLPPLCITNRGGRRSLLSSMLRLFTAATVDGSHRHHRAATSLDIIAGGPNRKARQFCFCFCLPESLLPWILPLESLGTNVGAALDDSDAATQIDGGTTTESAFLGYLAIMLFCKSEDSYRVSVLGRLAPPCKSKDSCSGLLVPPCKSKDSCDGCCQQGSLTWSKDSG
ncbi:uncharacterized protein DS421_12g367110 [Arachis hypogaea]|nr:uncharacterized protein DS421_12g367110 [Arachis hypogaea]